MLFLSLRFNFRVLMPQSSKGAIKFRPSQQIRTHQYQFNVRPPLP
jgi:hypothetical protein